MTIKVAIKHKTSYHFDRLTSIMPHEVRLRPAPHSRTPIESYSLKVEPGDHFINWQQDPFSNYLARLVFPEKARKLVFDVELIADMTVINPFDFFLEEKFETYPFNYDKQLKKDLAPYLQIREKGPLLMEWLSKVDHTEKTTIDFLVELNLRLQKDISYLIRMEPGVQTCEETLGTGSGSCRDSGWLLVQIMRHLGIAARFVSGYLVQLTADTKSLDGPSGPEEDFTDLHAWTEVFLPGAGWVGLDPTSGLLTAEGHIPLACTPDPISAAPVTGSTSTCEVEFSYENKVTRIYEDPRVTKPYTDKEWEQANELGHKVDADLLAQGVKLTMGGEPTFVSIDDMEGEQWNTAALGDEKLLLANELLWRLRKHFAPKGFVHHGQGKWYPGEQLPRWAHGIYWRTDGKTLWHKDSLLDTPHSETKVPKTMPRRFMQTVCEALSIDPKFMISAWEDQDYYLQREAQLPKNVEVSDSKLKDSTERKRLQKIFDRGLGTRAGYALPLAWQDKKKSAGWISSPWPLRRSKLFLVPGDSPMGFRLPLASLPWEIERDFDPERDPFEDRDELDYPVKNKSRGRRKADVKVTEKIIHTALCIEEREGKLYIFMPPLSRLEDYLSLLHHVESTAEALDTPVILEGYEPPRDQRLKKLMITPDPGVIEVNVHPAESWDEAVHITETLYEEARQSRLGTEKFMLDGKHTGTGGGNHVTVGAADPADSPFLHKPHLLASMIRYWQNHPALSYLFSGQFIGPTSQAPRVDEARDDNLYELEIALQQLPQGDCDQPWLIDRILRNFLVDLTGNTHRAEFCIDKLYAPGTASGRLGLVELRNFEMPPHHRMALVQMLLLRTLIAWFARKPYTEDLIPWGNQLHDRFMLPHFIDEDMAWIVRDIRRAGYNFELDWLLPFQEFRFPHYGRFHAGGLQVDLHGAIEPWHVLGEESSETGTSRYVDSSVERLQVKVQGLNGDRLILTCNGRQVPLQATGREAEYIAGVRYKAWAPWSALHPTIDVHTPLVFDVVDTVNKRSLGGCQYHVSHPGGRNYETFPVNAYEAEARRIARFSTVGHTQGRMKIKQEKPHPDCPATLDLRYQSGR